MKQDQETLGRYLKREREARHVTVEEIALFLGVKRSLADALEADDFDPFTRRSECLWLVKQYTAHLNLNQAEVLQRFEAQWKITGGVKRYPKLTHFTDRDSSREKPVGFKAKKLFIGHYPTRMGWLSFIVGILIIISFLFYYLPDRKREIRPPEPSPPSEIEKKATPAEDRVRPPAVPAGRKDIAPKGVSVLDTPRSHPALSGGKPAPLPTSVRVIGNRDTKRYHLPGMKYYDKVKVYHRVVFQSEKEAIRAGYDKARE
jgi:cytoskeletal protein RodZ